MRKVTSLIVLLALAAGARARAEDAAAKDDPARTALEKKMPEVKFDGIRVIDAVDFVRDVTSATIWFDRPALDAVQIDPAKIPVTCHVKAGAKLGEVLAELAKQMVGEKEHSCVVDAVGDVIVISTQAGAKAFVERHRAAIARGEKSGAIKLDRKLPEVTFAAVGLSDAVDFLRDITAAQIDVRWNDLQAAGVDRNAPVTLRARDLGFAQALRIILDEAGAKEPLDFEVHGKTLVISTAAKLKDAGEKGDGL